MSDLILRPWKRTDIPQLVTLWQTAFGDSEEYIKTYHSLFLKPGSCIVAEADGQAVSAMYIMDGPDIHPSCGEKLSTAYTYALATLPEYRRRGIGTAVYMACTAAALERADAACVLPAEEGLYSFYENASRSAPISCAREARFTRDELRGLSRAALARISVTEYDRLRQRALIGMPHASMNESFLALLEYHRKQFDGGLFASDAGIAAAEISDGTCLVWELLTSRGNGMSILAGVAACCPAENYIVRSPLFLDGPGNARPFMLGTCKVPVTVPADLWWGIAFD